MKKILGSFLSVIMTIMATSNLILAQPDVACKFADNMINTLSNSVCKITFTDASSQTVTCTGILLNNEAQDRKPYVLTARHCITPNNFDTNLSTAEISAAENSAIFAFRVRRTTCNGSINEQEVSYNKAVFKAANFYTDFALFEIAPENGSLAADLNYAGWSRLDESSSSNLQLIAHPSGNPQKYGRGHKSAVQSLDPWKYTVTWDEGADVSSPGASGGSLLSQFYRVIGVLSYGNPAGQANFGKFSKAWDDNSASNKQLKAWLSPNQNLSTMGTLVPLEQGPVSNICNNNTRTSTLPNLAPGQSVSWSVTPGLSIVSSTGNSVTVTSSSGQYGRGQINATFGPTTRSKDVYYGTPDVSTIKYDNGLSASNYNYVSPNTYHTIYMDQTNAVMANITGFVDWHASPSYGYSTGSYYSQYLVSLPAGQSVQFNPISATNSCGTSNRSMVFAAFSGFSIYPNPASDILSLQFDNTQFLETLPDEINLYSENSTRPVKSLKIKDAFDQKMFNDNNLALDVKGLPRGTYFLHVTPNKADKNSIEKTRIVLK